MRSATPPGPSCGATPSSRWSGPGTGCSCPTSAVSVVRSRWAARTTTRSRFGSLTSRVCWRFSGWTSQARAARLGRPDRPCLRRVPSAGGPGAGADEHLAWPDTSPFHTTVVPWRMPHAPVVGPHLLGRHNRLADRGVYLSVVDRAGFRHRRPSVSARSWRLGCNGLYKARGKPRLTTATALAARQRGSRRTPKLTPTRRRPHCPFGPPRSCLTTRCDRWSCRWRRAGRVGGQVVCWFAVACTVQGQQKVRRSAERQ